MTSRNILRTDSKHQDFINLVKLLDQELAIRDGDEHDFYDQFNKIDSIKYALNCYENGEAVGCGAIKEFDDESMEVKRMFVPLNHRKKGIASTILKGLEKWTKELGYKRLVLETGIRQPEAIALYEKHGFKRIDNYGQYVGMENSVCFQKKI